LTSPSSQAAITQSSSATPASASVSASAPQKQDKKDKVGILEVAADKLVELESLCSQLQQGLQTEKEKTKQLEALLMAPQHHQQHHRRRLRSASSSLQRQLLQHPASASSSSEEEEEDGVCNHVRIRDPFKRPPAAISSALIQSYHASVYSSTFLHSSAAMLVLSIQSGQCVDVNEQFCQLSGWSRDQLIGRFFTDKDHKKKLDTELTLGDDNGPTCDAVQMNEADDEDQMIDSDDDDDDNGDNTSAHIGTCALKAALLARVQATPSSGSSVPPSADDPDQNPDAVSMTNDLGRMTSLYHEQNSTTTNGEADADAKKTKESTVIKSSKKSKSKLLELYTGRRSLIRLRYRLKNGYGQMVEYLSRCWLGYAQNEIGESVPTYLIVQTSPLETSKSDAANDEKEPKNA
jgi:PAS domain-containing protein